MSRTRSWSPTPFGSGERKDCHGRNLLLSIGFELGDEICSLTHQPVQHPVLSFAAEKADEAARPKEPARLLEAANASGPLQDEWCCVVRSRVTQD